MKGLNFIQMLVSGKINPCKQKITWHAAQLHVQADVQPVHDGKQQVRYQNQVTENINCYF